MIRFMTGGPSYQLQVDARHAACMAEIAGTARVHGMEWGGSHYRHGCPVEMPRNALFQAALEDKELDQLLWMDSDTFVHPEDVQQVFDVLKYSSHSGLPFIGVPCNLRGDKSLSNVWCSDGEEVWKALMDDVHAGPCHAMGLGFAVFNLRQYRHHWPVGPWFYTQWQDGVFCSEDYVHTSQLQARARYAPHVHTDIRLIHAERGLADG